MPPPRKGPRFRTHGLALAISPKIYPHPDQIIYPRIRALVQQQRTQTGQWVHSQPCLDAPMHACSRELEYRKGPFPGEGEDAEEEVDELEDGDGADGGVEVGGEEVPEDFGPEEAFEGGGDLVCREHGWLVQLIVRGGWGDRGWDVQRAAVRTMRRAQWFLMSLPMPWWVVMCEEEEVDVEPAQQHKVKCSAE